MRMRKTALFLALLLILSLFVGAAFEESGEQLYEKLQIIAGGLSQYHIFAERVDDPVAGACQIVFGADKTREELIAYFSANRANFNSFCEIMVNQYDRYSHYIAPDTYAQSYRTFDGYVGIGIAAEKKGDVQVITRVYPGSGAQDAGVMAGDIFHAIEGVPLSMLTNSGILSLAQGPEGTTVEITILRGQDRTPIDLQIVRKKIEEQTLEAWALNDQSYYITIYGFEGFDTVDEFLHAMQEAKRYQNLIVDLRDCPGGDESALRICLSKLIAAEDVVMYRVEERGMPIDEPTSSGSGIAFQSVLILVNQYTASSAEILAGSLQDLGIAQVVGTQTYGKATGQIHAELDNSDYLVFSVAQVLLPESGSYEGVGITPDVQIEAGYRLRSFGEFAPLQLKKRLFLGDTGAAVLALEQRLALLGYLDSTPGTLCTVNTLLAVNAFLSNRNLPAVTFIGENTLRQVQEAVAYLENTLTAIDDSLYYANITTLF